MILNSIAQRGQLTEELKDRIMAAEAMAILEDIYLPYRPKRLTRAIVAKERGLEPLARTVFAQGISDPVTEAKKFVDNSKKIESVDDALAGARDIMADWINEILQPDPRSATSSRPRAY